MKINADPNAFGTPPIVKPVRRELCPYWYIRSDRLKRIPFEHHCDEVAQLPSMGTLSSDALFEIVRVFASFQEEEKKGRLKRKRQPHRSFSGLGANASKQGGGSAGKHTQNLLQTLWGKSVEKFDPQPSDPSVPIHRGWFLPGESPDAFNHINNRQETLEHGWTKRLFALQASLGYEQRLKLFEKLSDLQRPVVDGQAFSTFFQPIADHLPEASFKDHVTVLRCLRKIDGFPSEKFRKNFYESAEKELPESLQHERVSLLASAAYLGLAPPEKFLKAVAPYMQKDLFNLESRDSSALFWSFAVFSSLAPLPPDILNLNKDLLERIKTLELKDGHELSCYFAWLRFQPPGRNPFSPTLTNKTSTSEAMFIRRFKRSGYKNDRDKGASSFPKPDGTFIVNGKKLVFEFDGDPHFLRGLEDGRPYLNGKTTFMACLRTMVDPDCIQIRFDIRAANFLMKSDDDLLFRFMKSASELPSGAYRFEASADREFLFHAAQWPRVERIQTARVTHKNRAPVRPQPMLGQKAMAYTRM